MNKTKINISVNGVVYELVVDKDKEPLYRQAARGLEHLLVTMKSNWRVSKGDHISLAAFILYFASLEKEESSINNGEKLMEDILKKLDNIN